MPKLSIITVNLNNEHGLQKTMESVFEQTFTDYEYIIIDGGSTDGSKELIEKHQNKLVYWVSEKDNGVYYAMNKGIKKAQGEFCMFLNSGDYLVDAEVLETAVKFTNADKADIYYGNMLIELKKGKPVLKKHATEITLDILENETINHQASFIKTLLFKELGLYNTHYSLAADHAFYLKAYINGKVFSYVDLTWVNYQLDGISSLNSQQYFLQMKEIREQIIPGFVTKLRQENKAYKRMMDERIMYLARKASIKYSDNSVHFLNLFFKYREKKYV